MLKNRSILCSLLQIELHWSHALAEATGTPGGLRKATEQGPASPLFPELLNWGGVSCLGMACNPAISHHITTSIRQAMPVLFVANTRTCSLRCTGACISVVAWEDRPPHPLWVLNYYQSADLYMIKPVHTPAWRQETPTRPTLANEILLGGCF